MRFSESLILATILFASPAAYASDTGTGSAHVTRIYPQSVGGVLYFDTEVTRTGLPSCAAGQPIRWVVDVTSASGQMMAATALTAFALHKTVSVYGTGTCLNMADTENVSLLVVNS